MIDSLTPRFLTSEEKSFTDILAQELHDAAVAWKTLGDQECVFETLLQPAANRCLKNGWTDEQIANLVNAA